MSNPPQLPNHVSNDGREIWSWARDLSEWRHHQDKIRKLKADIADCNAKRCGNCTLWMTSYCPSERNENGRKRGPSMNAFACGKFDRKKWVSDLLVEREAELAELKAQVQP